MPACSVWTADVWAEREVGKGLSSVLITAMILVSPASTFVIGRISPDLALPPHSTMATNSWSCLYQSQLTQPCAIGPSCAMIFGLSRGGGSTRGQQCNGDHQLSMNCDQWRVIHISKVYQMDMSLLKCALYVFYFYWLSIDLCWLLTLGMFWGGMGERRKVVPVLLKQCFAQAWWILPYLFLFYLYFPWVGGVERGVLSKVEGQEELRTMTKRKITFPLEEKNKKKINGCLVCSCMVNALQTCITWELLEIMQSYLIYTLLTTTCRFLWISKHPLRFSVCRLY